MDFYRLIWAAEHLASQGHNIEIQWPEKGSGLEIHLSGDEIVDLVIPQGADVIVLQRVAHNWHSQAIGLMRQKGVAVVIDMDDDLTDIHRDNSAYANYHPRSNTPFSWKNTAVACRAATFVTVSTRSLLGVYAKHGRGAAIDNYVPERYLDIQQETDDVFGWAGTTQSHPADLQTCGRAVQELIDDGHKFRVIGPQSQVQSALRLKEAPEVTGVVPLDKWAETVAKLKVALAPLEISRFNSSKSRLKCIEASSVGVPWVASPRTEYRRLFTESGAGILVDKPKDWYNEVKRLMKDDALRKDLGEKGREYMRTQTIEKNSHHWLEAWTRAYEIQQADHG